MSYREKYSSLLSRLDYGNGNCITYSYDNQNRLIGQYVELPGIKELNYAYKYGKRAPDENFGEAIYGVSLNGKTNLS